MVASIHYRSLGLLLILKLFKWDLLVKNYLRGVINQIITVGFRLTFLHFFEQLHGFLENRVSIHLLQLLDSHWHNFVNLKEQKSILTKQLSCEVFIPIMVHKQMIMRVTPTQVDGCHVCWSTQDLLSGRGENCFQKVLIPFFSKGLLQLRIL